MFWRLTNWQQPRFVQRQTQASETNKDFVRDSLTLIYQVFRYPSVSVRDSQTGTARFEASNTHCVIVLKPLSVKLCCLATSKVICVLPQSSQPDPVAIDPPLHNSQYQPVQHGLLAFDSAPIVQSKSQINSRHAMFHVLGAVGDRSQHMSKLWSVKTWSICSYGHPKSRSSMIVYIVQATRSVKSQFWAPFIDRGRPASSWSSPRESSNGFNRLLTAVTSQSMPQLHADPALLTTAQRLSRTVQYKIRWSRRQFKDGGVSYEAVCCWGRYFQLPCASVMFSSSR